MAGDWDCHDLARYVAEFCLELRLMTEEAGLAELAQALEAVRVIADGYAARRYGTGEPTSD